MSVVRILHDLGALATLGVGLYAFARPLLAAQLLDLAPGGGFGRAGLRAMGGFAIGLGALALYASNPLLYAAIGAAWFGAAAAHLYSAVFESRTPRLYATAAGEATLAVLLLLH